MKLKDQLNLIIGLIALKLFVVLLEIFIPDELMYMDNLLFLFHKICDLVIVLYLYKFIKIDKKQNIAAIPIVMISTAILYFIMVRLIFIQFPAPISDQLWRFFIPYSIQLVGELILAIQLIKNKSEGGSRGSIKFVGISFLFTMALMVIYSIVTMTEILWVISIVRMMTLLPLIAMLYMYGLELKYIKVESEKNSI